ncbi:hypothetical protein MTR67_009187 [Solanum verrucosum]|uniref:Uncharacterized protein n=1 Tax=Solanum verrucosum TaxID=315347 RepID=A0AAF0TD55_SOLVR|nr:hypothetical protein MTR67_009187 [Solanum verrucosum]
MILFSLIQKIYTSGINHFCLQLQQILIFHRALFILIVMCLMDLLQCCHQMK